MTQKELHYNYDTTVREIYDLTHDEAFAALEEEKEQANKKNHVLILTGKGYENKSFFDAYSASKLTHNFTWIHFCPQEILNFDEDTPQEGKYYIMVFEGILKEIKNL